MPNNLSGCKRYKVGFWLLAVIIVIFISVYITSFVGKFTYQNKAAPNSLRPFQAPGIPGSSGGSFPTANRPTPDLYQHLAPFAHITHIVPVIEPTGGTISYNISFVVDAVRPVDMGLWPTYPVSPTPFPTLTGMANKTPTCIYDGKPVNDETHSDIKDEESNGVSGRKITINYALKNFADIINNFSDYTFRIVYRDANNGCSITQLSIIKDNSLTPTPTPTP